MTPHAVKSLTLCLSRTFVLSTQLRLGLHRCSEHLKGNIGEMQGFIKPNYWMYSIYYFIYRIRPQQSTAVELRSACLPWRVILKMIRSRPCQGGFCCRNLSGLSIERQWYMWRVPSSTGILCGVFPNSMSASHAPHRESRPRNRHDIAPPPEGVTLLRVKGLPTEGRLAGWCSPRNPVGVLSAPLCV